MSYVLPNVANLNPPRLRRRWKRIYHEAFDARIGFLPVILVLIFLLTQMRWKWSKPVVRPGATSEQVISNGAVTVVSSASVPAGHSPSALGRNHSTRLRQHQSAAGA